MELMEDRVYNIWDKIVGQKNNPDQVQIGNMSTAQGRNVELESLLIGEKQRSEQHHINFESLKNEYSKLEAQNMTMKNQIETLCNDNENIKQVYETLLSKARQNTKLLKENFGLKTVDYEQQLQESESKWKVLEQQLWAQVKDLKAQLANVISTANQHAHQVYLQGDELKWTKEQAAVYMKGAEENLKTTVEQIKKATQQTVHKKNDELQVEVSKALSISKEKTSLQLQIKTLLDEVEQLSQEKRAFSHQLAAVETEHNKTLMEQRVIITTLHGEMKLLQARLEDRTMFSERLKREKLKLEMEISAYQTELNTLNSTAQAITNQHQAELQRVQIKVETLKNALNHQEDTYRRKSRNEQIAQERIVRDVLQQNEQLVRTNQELNANSEKTLSSTNNVIKKLELKVIKLEIKLKKEVAEAQKFQQLLSNKQEECTNLKIQLSSEIKTNIELKKLLEDCQQLVENCDQNDEIAHLMSKINDRNDMQVHNLTKLLETNQEACKNLKTQLITEKEETRRLIEDMNKYEDMRHCKHNEEMLQLVSKIRDLKLQLTAEKVKKGIPNIYQRQANIFTDVMSVCSD